MHFIAFEGSPAFRDAPANALQDLIARQHGIDVEQSEPVRCPRWSFHARGILDAVAQHLKSSANPQHVAAAPDMAGKVDVPSLCPEESQIGYGGFRARQDYQVGIPRKRLARGYEAKVDVAFRSQRVEFIEVGDARQQRNGDADRRLSRRPLDDGVFRRQHTRGGEPRDDAEVAPSRPAHDLAATGVEQREVAAEFVDNEALDQSTVRCSKDRVRPYECGNDMTAIDVTNE